jgi:hypothetical protein
MDSAIMKKETTQNLSMNIQHFHQMELTAQNQIKGKKKHLKKLLQCQV